jgi:hypothetical protein
MGDRGRQGEVGDRDGHHPLHEPLRDMQGRLEVEATGMKVTRTDDGWLVFKEGKREVIRVKLPEGGMSRADLKAFEKHLIAHLHGAN